MLREKSKKYSVLFLALIIACSLTFSVNADVAFAKAKPKLKKITVSPKTVTMTVGSKKTLKVKFYPKNAKRKVTWKSSNKKVATVKKGVVTAKKTGTVTITVKAGKKKVRCKIKVKPRPYVNATSAYKYLNDFRTKKNNWYWNKGNVTKTYFNTNAQNTLAPLKRDAALEKTAKKRAMEIKKRFDHTRPDGSNCFTVYPSGLTAMGENIAYGTYNLGGAKTITNALIEETEYYEGQGHRRNMLDKKYNVVGIAGYKYKNATYWVQCFGRR